MHMHALEREREQEMKEKAYKIEASREKEFWLMDSLWSRCQVTKAYSMISIFPSAFYSRHIHPQNLLTLKFFSDTSRNKDLHLNSRDSH